jgi:hypothetical protein
MIPSLTFERPILRLEYEKSSKFPKSCWLCDLFFSAAVVFRALLEPKTITTGRPTHTPGAGFFYLFFLKSFAMRSNGFVTLFAPNYSLDLLSLRPPNMVSEVPIARGHVSFPTTRPPQLTSTISLHPTLSTAKQAHLLSTLQMFLEPLHSL